MVLYVNVENVTYFDSFRVKHIPKEIKKLIGNKCIVTNICRIQPYNSIMCGYFCIGFIDFMLKGKILLEYPNLFSPNEYKKNSIVIFTINIESLKTLKYHIFLNKMLNLSVVYSKCGHEYKKIFKEVDSIEKLKIIG